MPGAAAELANGARRLTVAGETVADADVQTADGSLRRQPERLGVYLTDAAADQRENVHPAQPAERVRAHHRKWRVDDPKAADGEHLPEGVGADGQLRTSVADDLEVCRVGEPREGVSVERQRPVASHADAQVQDVLAVAERVPRYGAQVVVVEDHVPHAFQAAEAAGGQVRQRVADDEETTQAGKPRERPCVDTTDPVPQQDDVDEVRVAEHVGRQRLDAARREVHQTAALRRPRPLVAVGDAVDVECRAVAEQDGWLQESAGPTERRRRREVDAAERELVQRQNTTGAKRNRLRAVQTFKREATYAR